MEHMNGPQEVPDMIAGVRESMRHVKIISSAKGKKALR